MMLTAAAMATTTSAPTASAAFARRLNRPTGGETAVIAMSFPRRHVIAKDAEKVLADSWQAASSRGASPPWSRNSRIERQTALVIVVDAAQSYCPLCVHQIANGANMIGPDH